jgi:hypothetical protein
MAMILKAKTFVDPYFNCLHLYDILKELKRKMTVETMEIKDRMRQPFCIVEIFLLEDQALSTFDKMIYIALCSFASAKDRECFPSVEAIAKRASCSERQVRVSLCVLEKLGYIQRRFVTGKATVYTILDLDERVAHSAEVPDAQDTPAPHAGGDGTTCRRGRHTVPTNKKYLTRTKEQE